jgi:hypothetical protein
MTSCVSVQTLLDSYTPLFRKDNESSTLHTGYHSEITLANYCWQEQQFHIKTFLQHQSFVTSVHYTASVRWLQHQWENKDLCVDGFFLAIQLLVRFLYLHKTHITNELSLSQWLLVICIVANKVQSVLALDVRPFVYRHEEVTKMDMNLFKQKELEFVVALDFHVWLPTPYMFLDYFTQTVKANHPDLREPMIRSLVEVMCQPSIVNCILPSDIALSILQESRFQCTPEVRLTIEYLVSEEPDAFVKNKKQKRI